MAAPRHAALRQEWLMFDQLNGLFCEKCRKYENILRCNMTDW
jgi:hypothetical protein